MISQKQQMVNLWGVYNQQEQHNKYWILLYFYLLKTCKYYLSLGNYKSREIKLTAHEEQKVYQKFRNELIADSIKIQKYIEEHLKDTYIKTWEATLKNIESNTPLPSLKEIYEDINKVWVGDKNFKDRQAHNTKIIENKLHDLLLDESLDIEEKFLQAQKIIGHYRYMIERLVRTETIHTMGQASIKCMIKNNIGYVQWITCMDERTCIICWARDMRVYPINVIPQYPDHPNCRCLLLPYKLF